MRKDKFVLQMEAFLNHKTLESMTYLDNG